MDAIIASHSKRRTVVSESEEMFFVDGVSLFFLQETVLTTNGIVIGGEHEGKTTHCYRHGKARDSGTYIRGKKHGMFTYWHLNGEKSAEGR